MNIIQNLGLFIPRMPLIVILFLLAAIKPILFYPGFNTPITKLEIF